jgi:hypothetical protein
MRLETGSSHRPALRPIWCRWRAAERGSHQGRIGCGAALLLLAATVAACATVPREPLILPTVVETYAVPYDVVWEATVRSLGAVKPIVAAKAEGRIESDVFSYQFGFANDASQIIWVSVAIAVSRTDAQHTAVQVQTRVHDMLLVGILPGPLKNPWVDLFARIRGNLGLR